MEKSQKMKKVISFSFWGQNPKYNEGALQNMKLAPIIYPGWTPRFYVSSRDTDKSTIKQLKDLGAEVIEIIGDGDWRGMFWRFYPNDDPTVDVFISRDCDSRLNKREAEAVNEWLASDYNFHIIRDHPYHKTPILGGLWGSKKGCIRNIIGLINNYRGVEDKYQTDQNFLKEVIYPFVYRTAMVHDPFFEQRYFPSLRPSDFSFCGEVFDENNNYNIEHREILKQACGGKIIN